MRARHLHLAVVLTVTLSLGIGYFVTFAHDMFDFISWQLATSGWRPWGAYDAPRNNYPPGVHYLLTIVEGARAALGVEPRSAGNALLVKVPNLLAGIVGAHALNRSLAPRVGQSRAAVVAVAWVTSLGFVANVVWGQFDVLESLLLLLALLAALRGSLVFLGAWLGVALATKIQIVFALPIVGIYLLARHGGRGTLLATLGGVAGLVISFLPMALGGRLPQAVGVYGASVGTWAERASDAWNPWEIANGVELKLLGRPRESVIQDTRPVVAAVPGFTQRHLSIVLFGAYELALMVAVARRRTLRALMLAVPLAGVGMFMLATEMCQRYLVPPAALMVLWLLLEPRWRWHFFYWSISAGMNQIMTIVKDIVPGGGSTAYALVGAPFMAANVGMFVWLSWSFFTDRDRCGAPSAFEGPPDAASASPSRDFPSAPKRPA